MTGMQVYPSVLLKRGDAVESPNWGNDIWYVVDVVDGVPLLCDGTHVFSPSWGFYVKTDSWLFKPIID